jgi:hypothetical protein
MCYVIYSEPTGDFYKTSFTFSCLINVFMLHFNWTLSRDVNILGTTNFSIFNAYLVTKRFLTALIFGLHQENCEKLLLASSFVSVCPCALNNSVPTGGVI